MEYLLECQVVEGCETCEGLGSYREYWREVLEFRGQLDSTKGTRELTARSSSTRYTSSCDCIETSTDSADVMHPLSTQRNQLSPNVEFVGLTSMRGNH